MAVLITRPITESIKLQNYLKDEVQSFIYPTLTTKKLSPLLPQKHYQFVVFISKNAVDYGIKYLQNLANYKILAVGEKTANRLKNLGFNVSHYPRSNPSSKSLLAIPEVSQITGSNILIFRGKGGVETLKNGFVAHNNAVDYLEVYERKIIENNDKFTNNLHKFLQQHKQIILITSCDILDGLLELTKVDKNIMLLVVSERIKKYANSLGFSNIIVTKDISNQSIKESLQKWLN